MSRPSLIAIALSLSAVVMHAQSTQPASATTAEREAEGAITESPEEITTQLSELEDHRSTFSYGSLSPYLNQWDRLWNRVDENAGLRIGFAYTTLFQTASNGTYLGPRNGGSGDLDIFGRWRLVGDRSKTSWFNEGMLGFNLEYRHAIGPTTPAELGNSLGSLWNTTTGFNEMDFDIVQAWWQQKLFQDELAIRVGILDLSVIFDAYRFNSPNFFFINQAFSDNPTIPFPEAGFGTVASWHPTDHLFAIVGTGNADGSRTQTASSLSENHDAWFSAATFGWRGPVADLEEGLFQATVWHSDKRSASNRPSATGASFVAQQELGNGWVPFARYAFSSDHVTDTAHLVTAGAVLEGPFGKTHDRLGLSVGYGKPHEDHLRSQWVGELFYRFEILPELQISPSAQLIVNPSRNSDTDAIGILGIRCRLNF